MRCDIRKVAAGGYEKAMLWVFVENHRARRFYEARGFHATDRTKPALGTVEICYETVLPGGRYEELHGESGDAT